MRHHHRVLAVFLAVCLLGPLTAARAQQQEWFVPTQGQKAAPARPAARPAATQPAPAPQGGINPEGIPSDSEPVSPQQLQAVLPPAPEVPPIQRGALPPAAVIGVISVPNVIRSSTAAQAVDKELGSRMQKLNEDVQKERTTLRDMRQAAGNDQSKIQKVQERASEADSKFAKRQRIINEAREYAGAQIERTLLVVVRNVAASRGMNLVLHGPQVALNIPEFDITQEVVTELNQVLPSVSLPPDGVSVLDMKPTAATTPATTPAAAPAVPASAAKKP